MNLFLMFPALLRNMGLGLFSEEEGESLHHEINLESAQLSCVRSDPERL